MKTRLLSRKERAYIISKISGEYKYTEDFPELSEKEEDELILSIIGKIQAPQDLPLDYSEKDHKQIQK